MSTDREDSALRRYRQASGSLDERPSAATRAAILAAAARHVDAGPRSLETAGRVRQRRWPLAAAAAVLLSTLAVMVATRTEQEMPTFTAPVERSAEPAASPPAPPIAPAPGTGDASQAIPPRPAAQPTPAPAAAPSRNEAAPKSRGEAPPAASARRDAAPEAAADSASPVRSRPDGATASKEAQRAAPPAPAAPPPGPSAPEPQAAKRPAQAATGALGASEAAGAAVPEAARAQEGPAARQAPAPTRALPAPRPESAQEWLERIVQLRGAGRHAEADAELKRFRELYPEVQVPSAALPAGGAAATR